MPQEPERFAHSRANDLVGRQHEEANEFLIKKRASIRGASRRPADAAARGCRVPQIPHPVVLTARRVSSAMYSLVPENSLAKIRKIGFDHTLCDFVRGSQGSNERFECLASVRQEAKSYRGSFLGSRLSPRHGLARARDLKGREI